MKKCRWLKPTLVAQVEFTEWTPDSQLKHLTFIGLRDDKDPREVCAGGMNKIFLELDCRVD
jgi:ATP-dependent DNA ligase